MQSIVTTYQIEEKIHVIRGQRVMLAYDLAHLYGVSTKRLNEQVRRNIRRFPTDFMLQLTPAEFRNLRSQFATSSWGGSRYLPYAFTEQGVAMLSSVLNTDRAIDVNIAIMRVFVKIRSTSVQEMKISRALQKLGKKVKIHDVHIQKIFETIRELMNPPLIRKRRIGFRPLGPRREGF